MVERVESYALIGCKVSAEKLWIERNRTPGCKNRAHERIPGGVFCPDCGKSVGDVVTYEKRFGKDKGAVCATVHRIHPYDAKEDGVIIVRDRFYIRAFAGVAVSCIMNYGDIMCPLPEANLDRKRYKDQLEALDLWDEDTFGLWAIARKGGREQH